MMRSPRRGRARALLLAGLLLADPALGARVAFHLVPEHLYTEARQGAGHDLEEGTVYLYRGGHYEPELILPLNHPEEIPVGTWHWIGEAPGRVTVGTGTLVVREPGLEGTKHIAWPVVPACRFELERGPVWRGVHRVDVVSLTRGSVVPVLPGKRGPLHAPAGPAMVYSVGTRGLAGIYRVSECREGETVSLEVPEPPPPGEQDLLVRVDVPEGTPAEDRERIELVARLPGADSAAEKVLPDATVWSGDRLSAFFLSLSASRELEILARGPGLRTAVEPLEALGGSARELPVITMRRLRDVAVRVDYQPLREHDPAYLEIRHCGRKESARRLRASSCDALEQRPQLRAGLVRYTFEDLDDGLYVVRARIGDEVIHHMGPGFSIFLDPATNEPPGVPEASLIELEVWGHLLEDDEPVPGEVRLVPITADWPLRRFPTDEDLTYHLTYFGRPPLYDRPELEGRDAKEALELYAFYSLAACDSQGACHVYSHESTIRGSGRLDLEVPEPRGLEVTVLDARNGRPLSGAEVVYRGSGKELHFDHGEVEFVESGWVPTASRTGGNGVARIAGLPAGKRRITIRHEGYRSLRGEAVRIPDKGFAERTVRLEPEGDSEASEKPGRAFTFPSGVPLANAFLLTLNEDGARTACSTSTDAEGIARFAEGCPGDGHVVVLHARARITVLDASRVRTASELEIQGAPPRLLRIRVVDEEGVPVPRVWLELRYPDVTLGSGEFLLAQTRTGSPLLTATDEAGVALLRGVDPRAVTVPEVAPSGAPEDAGVPLAAYQPGDTVEVVLPRER